MENIITILSNIPRKNVVDKNVNPGFISIQVPAISIRDLVTLLSNFVGVRIWHIVYYYLYVYQKSTNTFFDEFNIHRLTVTALLLALKYTHDSMGFNPLICQILHLDYDDLFNMEKQFLIDTDWRIYFNPSRLVPKIFDNLTCINTSGILPFV